MAIMKTLFFIESLHSGGKERRLVELLKNLSKYEDISMELVLTRSYIHYTDIFNLDVKIHYIERKHFKKDPSLFFKFYRLARKFKPDIIHVWGNLAAIYAIPTKIILRIPLINSQITNAPLHVNSGLLSIKLTFPFSNFLIANSKAGIKSYSAPKSKSRVIYNGFDFDRIEHLETPEKMREKLNISTKHVVGMVASFSLLKDYVTYIQAAKEISKRNSDITFLCIGAGNNDSYRKLVLPEIANRIRFLGPQQNVESIMNICDIGVLATYTEGMSNSIMEYMALGKPVIATDGGGTKELIKNYVTGFLVKPRSPKELASKIEYLFDNEKIASNMGEKGRERIRQEFSIEKMIKEYLKMYNKVFTDYQNSCLR